MVHNGPYTSAHTKEPAFTASEEEEDSSEAPWKRYMYLGASVVGSVALVIGIVRAGVGIRDHDPPHLDLLVMSYLLAAAFLCKTPYIWPKTLARNVLFAWGVGWLVIAVLQTVSTARGAT